MGHLMRVLTARNTMFTRRWLRKAPGLDRLIRLALVGVILLGNLLALQPAPAQAAPPQASQPLALPPSLATPPGESGLAPASPTGLPVEVAGKPEIAAARTLHSSTSAKIDPYQTCTASLDPKRRHGATRAASARMPAATR